MNGLRHDGHLTDLALEYALDGSPLPATEGHLESCDTCQQRLAAADAVELPEIPGLSDGATATMPPQASLVEPQAAPTQVESANRPWMAAVGAMLAAAAILLVAVPAVLSTGPDDGIRVKGGGLALQVFRDEGETSARLKDGDTVAPGDRLGFRVRNRDAGYLLVFGVDSADAPYVCYPQSEGGDAVEVEASARPRQLPEAIRMDEAAGTETLFAVLCEGPFTLDEVVDAARAGDAPAGCALDRVTLEKP